MNYITDTDKILNWSDRDCLSSWVMEFSHEKNDYFLNYRMMWNEVVGDIFTFNIGGELVDLPAGFHVMIGDVYGEVDWISSDEMVNRNVDIVIITKTLDNWSLKPAKFVSVKSGSVLWPKTKNIIPMISTKNVLIVSDKDIYTKTLDLNITDLLV